MAKKLSLAQLKRDANSGRLSLLLTEWYGKTGEEIKPRLQGVRKVLRANTIAIILQNLDGAESECRLDHGAALVDYDGESLTIYAIGKRKPTEEERALLNAWQKKEKEIVEKNWYSEPYWYKMEFFKDSKFPYLNGSEMIRGKKYIPWEDMVMDCSIRGEAILKYKVFFDAEQVCA